MYKNIALFCLLQINFINAELSLYRANIWQTKDSDGTTLPYFTRTFLQELQQWPISRWKVFIWGSGYCPAESTLFWLVRKSKNVTYVDWNQGWIHEQRQFVKNNLKLDHKVIFKCRMIEQAEREDSFFGKISINTNNDFGEDSPYVNAILEDDTKYDCIIVDGQHRNSCVEVALKRIKPGGIMILNNSNQATIGMNNEKAHQLLSKYPHHSFLHPGHLDWRTDYWVIN